MSLRAAVNSLAVRLPADCLRQAGLQEGDQIDIVVGPDGRQSLVPLRKLDRSPLRRSRTAAAPSSRAFRQGLFDDN